MNDLAGFGDGKTSDAENFVETVRRVCRIAYPVTALIQTVGTGIGMGGAVHYSISHAKGMSRKASITLPERSGCCFYSAQC